MLHIGENTYYGNWDTELLLKRFNEEASYDCDLCSEICKRANLLEEWEKSDGDNFDMVLDKALEILNYMVEEDLKIEKMLMNKTK